MNTLVQFNQLLIRLILFKDAVRFSNLGGQAGGHNLGCHNMPPSPLLIGMGLLEIPNAHPAHLLVAVLLLFLNRSRSQSIILNTITKGSAGIAEQLKIFLFNFIFGMIRTFFFSFAWSYRIHKDVR